MPAPIVLSEQQARQRISQLQNQEEKRVNKLLLDFGFQAVDFNIVITNSAAQQIGEIDSVFLFENHVLIVEVTNEADLATDSIVAWFSKWSDEGNIQRLLSRYNLPTRYHPHRVFFVLSEERPSQLSINLQRVLQAPANRIIYLDELQRYEENFSIVGRWEINNFLNYLEIKRSRAGRRPVPAVLFYVSGKPAYAFSLSARELLEIAFISRRYKNDLGFQRAIDRKKVDNIKRAIEEGRILAFPNSILINSLSELLDDKPLPRDCPVHVTINLPEDYSSCRIIDGQHRMLGFSKVQGEIASAFNLPIVAFEQLTSREEIDTFIVINSEQKRVDANLVLLLMSDSSWTPESKFFWQKIAVDVVKKLNERSCLADKIFMGYADQTRAGTLVTLATLVKTIIQNRFIGTRPLFQNSIDDIQTPYRRIKEIFDRMGQHHFPFFSSGQQCFFLTNRGLRIMFRFVYLFYRNTTAGYISISFDDAIQMLAKVIDANIKEELERYYGEGGAKKAVEQLVETLKHQYAEFSDFQSDLRRV